MDRNLALILIFGLSILGPCAVFAAGCYASISALGRNPSAAPKIFTALIIALVFAQALAVITILVVFQLFTP
jgi:F0F1-type ATP synthase membrane subunit c/vacuolar-type H+-ATPase subunit K